MAVTRVYVPSKYKQPISQDDTRYLTGELEQVNYVPQSHLRIWYNTQTCAYSVHHHPAYEIILCVENLYPTKIAGKMLTMNVDDILIIPPHTLHELYGGPGSRFIMLIDPLLLSGFSDMNVLEPFISSRILYRRSEDPELYDMIRGCLDEMIDFYFAAGSTWELNIYSVFLRMLSGIGRHVFENAAVFSSTKADDPSLAYNRFSALLRYIDAHYAEDLSLEWGADYTGFSKYYFLRLFKEYTGTTFHDHLLHKRIQAAQALLSDDYSITDIAVRTGFNSPTSFNRSFRKYTGMTPTQYRAFRESKDTYALALSAAELDRQANSL